MDRDQAAPLIAVLAYEYMRKAVAESAAPGAGASYGYPIAPAAIETLLRQRPAGWFADWDAVLVQSLTDAVDEGRRMQGRNLRDWRYGTYLQLLIANPVVHQFP